MKVGGTPAAVLCPWEIRSGGLRPEDPTGGQGTAAATVRASLVEDGEGTTVTVATDLTITGKPAQFGRGLIEDVTRKMIDQFADCLRASLGSTEGPHAPTASP